ncbi:GntR family transcriptional regulator [Cohnella sp. CFH 77786]|uniref:GntR family transcriptional regulator n=1 Tax=Cohnella sp. CFH 77786 TaxID=2662265 RepID=UPI001C60BE50|nr:GntR family transcriptional regulator [Cohnella sp. CFH 77786]MBW5447847.1 GntR family transcriptional regulator [Cohnella sp. CFH 77786]
MSKTPLYKQIQQSIRDGILSGELRPKDRVPSEQELMEAYNVSKITVKNALAALADEGIVIRIQGKGTFVADRPFEAVPAAAAALPATRSAAGKYIGFIIPTLKTKVIQQLVDHMEYFVKEAGYQLVLHLTRESSAEESRAIQELTDCSEVKGIIVFPTEDETYNESLLRLSLEKFPFVFIDRYLRNIETYQVTSDNFGGVYDAVSILLDEGHRQIALISPDNTNTAIQDRTAGFEKAYIDRGIPIDKNQWCHVPIQVLRNENTYSYLLEFLENNPNITAAVTLTAEMADLTFRAIQSGKLPDRNIKLLSFDDPHIPGIPWVGQDEKRMAHSAVQLLLQQFEGAYSPQKVVIPVQLNR